jgi:hypothetical protein
MFDSAIVSLTTGQTKREFSADKVYFPFGSGRLDYDCVQCDAKCCHGFGYDGVVGREFDAQVQTNPAVRLFLAPCGNSGGHFHATNLPPGCFFLAPDNRCGIQLAHGYAAKPETCRLFPFNSLSVVGDYLVVAPHSDLCPLAVVPFPSTSDCSRHGHLLAELARSPIGGHVPTRQPQTADVDRLIALERFIVEGAESTANVNMISFTKLQIAATESASLSDSNFSSMVSISLGPAPYLEALYRTIGLPAPEPAPEVDALFVALVPSLRSRLVFGPAPHLTVTPNGRAPMLPSIVRVPHFLLALYAVTMAARTAGMRRITYQTVTRIAREYDQLLWLLAHLDVPLGIRQDALVTALTPNAADERLLQGLLARLLTNMRSDSPHSFYTLLESLQPFANGSQLTLLRAVAPKLAPLVEPFRKRSRRSSLRHPVATLQHWALLHSTYTSIVLQIGPNGNISIYVLLDAIAAHTPGSRPQGSRSEGGPDRVRSVGGVCRCS